MRRVHPVISATLLLLTACDHPGGVSTSAACAQPTSSASRSTVSPGQSVVLTATDMFDGCDDQGYARGKRAFRGLTVSWTQNSRSTQLDTVDADSAGRMSVRVTIPRDARPGPAALSLKYG